MQLFRINKKHAFRDLSLRKGEKISFAGHPDLKEFLTPQKQNNILLPTHSVAFKITFFFIHRVEH